MARKYTEEEKNSRIELVGEYFLKTGKSTREIAKDFSENYFEISNNFIALGLQNVPHECPPGFKATSTSCSLSSS